MKEYIFLFLLFASVIAIALGIIHISDGKDYFVEVRDPSGKVLAEYECHGSPRFGHHSATFTTTDGRSIEWHGYGSLVIVEKME